MPIHIGATNETYRKIGFILLLGGGIVLQELIDTYEKLKKFVYILYRGNKESIIIEFKDENFYHLAGLHKTKINMYFPSKIISKEKKYKYMKSHINKFNNILESEIDEKNTLEYRVNTFHYLMDLLKDNSNTILYDLKEKVSGSMYNGDYGLFKIYQDIYCLLGLKEEKDMNEYKLFAPQSWMASNRPNRLIVNKRPIYLEKIVAIPLAMYNAVHN